MLWNKELYLCTKIAWKNHKFFLSKKKKYALVQKYIALNYLNKMNYDFLDDIKANILKDIKNISAFSKSMSFIFDVTKMSNPISYAVFYSMQYVFWQVVVAGGILTNKKLSAKLLLNSLATFGKEPNDLVIEDNETTNLILESKSFKNRINQLIQKYGEGKEEFIVDDSAPTEDILIRFENSDLLYASHDATMFAKANKDTENKWNFEIEIIDTYDFTDFKALKEYAVGAYIRLSKEDEGTNKESESITNQRQYIKEYADNKITLRIDEQASEIVRRIFFEVAYGISTKEVANRLYVGNVAD